MFREACQLFQWYTTLLLHKVSKFPQHFGNQPKNLRTPAKAEASVWTLQWRCDYEPAISKGKKSSMLLMAFKASNFQTCDLREERWCSSDQLRYYWLFKSNAWTVNTQIWHFFCQPFSIGHSFSERPILSFDMVDLKKDHFHGHMFGNDLSETRRKCVYFLNGYIRYKIMAARHFRNSSSSKTPL